MSADPLLRSLDLLRWQSGRRQDRASFLLVNADDNVAAVQVVVVIGERTDCLEHLGARRLRIPRCFELHPFRLYAAAIEKVIKIDRKNCTHG